MGMFDTVHLKCPNCNKTVEEQTKSGPCLLKDYTIKTAPLSVMVGIAGRVICYHCHEQFVVEMVTKPTYQIRKLREGEDDEVDLSVLQGD